MNWFFVNLKRFDVPASYGGLNRSGTPIEWIRTIMERSAELGLDSGDDRVICYLVGEGLLDAAIEARRAGGGRFSIGTQGCYRSDVGDNGNFGAFTSLSPASASAALGAEWTIIGHSEERRDKLDLLRRLPGATDATVQRVVDEVLAQETARAHRRGMRVLFCIGETAEERGEGGAGEVLDRVRGVLRRQIATGLPRDTIDAATPNVVIGYEPIWAIGPGRTPPDPETIDRIAAEVKSICRDEIGTELPVVYGGGLKETNAHGVGAAASVDGGLVALTRFEQPIGFDTDDFARIIEIYNQGAAAAG